MASYLSQALLLLFSVVFCALCGAGSADPANMRVELFKPGSIDALKPRGGGVGDFNVARVASPFLLGISDVMVGLVNVQKTDGKRNILTKYIWTQGDKWGDRAMEDNGQNWEAQVAWEEDKPGEIIFASVARDNSIYVFSAAKPPSPQEAINTKVWDFQLTVGTITDAAEKEIEWDPSVPLNRFVTEIPQNFRDASLRDGSAFLTDDGTVLFVFRAFDGRSNKYAFMIVRSKNLQDDFKFSYITNAAGRDFSFFSWDNQLFVVPLDCFDNDDDLCKLQQSNDMGETWGEATAPLAKKLGTSAEIRAFFTPITIERERVLLFTQEVPKLNDPSGKININLMIADEEHNEDLGLIVADVRGAASGSLFYTNDELFFLSMQNNDAGRIIFVRLKKQLWKIKRRLKKWSAEKRAKRPEDHSAGPLSSEVSPQQKTEDHLPVPPSSEVSPQQKTKDHLPVPLSSEVSPQQKTENHLPEPLSSEVSPQKKTKDHLPVPPSSEVSPQKKTKDHSPGPLCSLALAAFFFCRCVLFGM